MNKENIRNKSISFGEVVLRGVILLGIAKLFTLDIATHFDKIMGQDPHSIIRAVLFGAGIATIYPTQWFNRPKSSEQVEK